MQGGLGLPDRENYVSIEPPMQAMRTRYQEYVGKLLALAGFDRTEQRAEAVMALETAIAQSQATREASAIDHNADQRVDACGLRARGARHGLVRILYGGGIGQAGIVRRLAAHRGDGCGGIGASQPLEAWKDYLRFHVLDRYADVLPHPSPRRPSRCSAAAATGGQQTAARSNARSTPLSRPWATPLGRCTPSATSLPSRRRACKRIVANVAAAFVRRVEAVTWMSPDTRTVALAKLKKLYVGIGYPERWQDYSDLVVDPRDAAGQSSARRGAELPPRSGPARPAR